MAKAGAEDAPVFLGNLDPTPGDPGDRAVLLAAPRGYCAGVDRAVITVEKALDLYGAPVYVRKQIVHLSLIHISEPTRPY